MPELAEVEFYRKQWNAGLGDLVTEVAVHEGARLFRRCEVAALREWLPGARLVESEAHGKRLLFRFRREGGEALWLGLHLGMTGRLFPESGSYRPKKHDHLVINLKNQVLVFADSRQFGRVDFARGDETPVWWRVLPLPLLSAGFTPKHVQKCLKRHGRASIKAVLLMQGGFPGLGNWMVDEILWQTAIHPARAAGSLGTREQEKLVGVIRSVASVAMSTIGEDFRDPPEGWLFHERWQKGGLCPRTGEPLRYETIAGRTTCWSPGVQEERGG